MKVFLFCFVLFLLIVFTNNKKEFFSDKIVGDISFEDYSVDDEKLSKFLSDNLLEPRKMTYTLGAEGKGVEQEITTLSFKPENAKSAIGSEGVKKIGETEITNLEALIPILHFGVKKNFENINEILIAIEDLKGQIVELKK